MNSRSNIAWVSWTLPLLLALGLGGGLGWRLWSVLQPLRWALEGVSR